MFVFRTQEFLVLYAFLLDSVCLSFNNRFWSSSMKTTWYTGTWREVTFFWLKMEKWSW